MKKLFKNYNLELDKNERKIVSTFLKQAIKQIQGNEQYFPIEKAFNSIVEKIDSSDELIKLTKDEYYKLKLQIIESTRQFKKQLDKSWFIKKWLYRSMIKQYNSLIENHFKD